MPFSDGVAFMEARMRSKQAALGLILVLLLTGLACNLPFSSVQTVYITPTPNETMTALFGSGVLGTLTVQAQEVKAITLTPATATPTQTVTSTATQTSTQTLTPTTTVTPTVTPTSSPTGPTITMTPPPTLTPLPGYNPSPRPNIGPDGVSGYRSPVFTAPYLYTQPALDGNWDDWNSDVYSASNLTYGSGNWVGSQDLSANFRVGWDTNYLYIAAKVTDDVYAQNTSGYNLYLGDSLEILFDNNLSGDFKSNQLSADDYQLGISPSREAYLWYPSSIGGSRTQVQVSSTRQDGLTTYEAFIPWSVFNVSPAANRAFGFALSVSDNDNTAANVQQSMVSSSPNRHLTRPMTWGELILTQ
jgi:hypothetical protein